MEQQQLEQQLGAPVGWGLAAHARELPVPPELRWFAIQGTSGTDYAPSTMHVPLDLMMITKYASAQWDELLLTTITVLL